jgi:hypothetical protein
MSSPWRQLPQPARAIALAVDDAVAAATARDREDFDEATARLATLDPQQVGLVLGAVVRTLLEDLHPDGLTGDDVGAVLERCVRAGREWFPAVDPDVLLVLLAGTLDVHDPDDDERPPSPLALAQHGPLLTADLLAVSGRPLGRYLTASFAEIARAETIELP